MFNDHVCNLRRGSLRLHILRRKVGPHNRERGGVNVVERVITHGLHALGPYSSATLLSRNHQIPDQPAIVEM